MIFVKFFYLTNNVPVILEALCFSLSLGSSFSLNYFSTFSTKIFIVLFMEVPPPHLLYLLLPFFIPEKECRSGVDHLETGNHLLTLALPTNSVIITHAYLDISAYCRSTFNLSLIIFLLKGCHLFSNFYFILHPPTPLASNSLPLGVQIRAWQEQMHGTTVLSLSTNQETEAVVQRILQVMGRISMSLQQPGVHSELHTSLVTR